MSSQAPGSNLEISPGCGTPRQKLEIEIKSEPAPPALIFLFFSGGTPGSSTPRHTPVKPDWEAAHPEHTPVKHGLEAYLVSRPGSDNRLRCPRRAG